MQTGRAFRILIVGGGTAGWMTAAALAKHYNKQADISVLESADIGTVGVGEATIPTIRQFYHGLGMSDQEVISSTEATCKLGIEFCDWHQQQRNIFHPFGLFGQKMAGIEFQHYWLRCKQQGQGDSLWNYSLATQIAQAHRFALPSAQPKSELSVFDWALHIDAGLFAELMKRKAMANGVQHIEGTIKQARLDPDSGEIESLLLDDGQILYGDLFVDCSGFHGVLIEQTLQTGYCNWQQWLLCDSAYAMQTQAGSQLPPYTKVRAKSAGWSWEIPLQHRLGQGHVYSSAHMDDQQALDTLLQDVQTGIVKEPRKISFTPGRRKLAWNKNCVAIGLSAGFLEPLESTSIALIQTGIERLVESLTQFNVPQVVKDEFNNTTQLEYERVRDFIIAHYKLSHRPDDPFWQACNQLTLPDELQHKLDLYLATGNIVNYRWEIFHQPSWLAILAGMNVLPEHYDQRIDQMVDQPTLDKVMQKMKKNIADAMDKTMTHHAFIRQHCRT